MHFEGIGFNKEWVASIPFDEFVKHESHHGLSREKMKEVYDLINADASGTKKKSRTVIDKVRGPVPGNEQISAEDNSATNINS